MKHGAKNRRRSSVRFCFCSVISIYIYVATQGGIMAEKLRALDWGFRDCGSEPEHGSGTLPHSSTCSQSRGGQRLGVSQHKYTHSGSMR